MACCLMAPSHYLNQCWLFISEVFSFLWHPPEGNFTVSGQSTILYNKLENYILIPLPIEVDGWVYWNQVVNIVATSPKSNDKLLLRYILFYSILFYSILFYSILFYIIDWTHETIFSKKISKFQGFQSWKYENTLHWIYILGSNTIYITNVGPILILFYDVLSNNMMSNSNKSLSIANPRFWRSLVYYWIRIWIWIIQMVNPLKSRGLFC